MKIPTFCYAFSVILTKLLAAPLANNSDVDTTPM